MNTSQTPPGGWQFHQPQTGWSAPFPVGNTHDQQVVNIIKHRLANPAVTAKHRLATDFNNVANELQRFTEMRLGIPAAPKSMPPPPEQPHVAGAVAEAVRNVKKLASGAALLLEWQESGGSPVPPDVSAARAEICSFCPKNDTKKGLTAYFTTPVANEIRKKLEKLHALKLSTPSDSTLGTCSACLCPLPLKVHTPLHLILSRLKQDQKADLDPRCWILRRN
jgi:hypothetical protein